VKTDTARRSAPAVITGLGAVTCLGNGIDAFWQAVQEGRHGFSPIRLFSTEAHRTGIAAGVSELPALGLRRLEDSVLARADRLALAAAFEAMGEAGLVDPATGKALFPKRTGIIVGTAAGAILGLESFFRKSTLGEPVEAPLGLLSSFCLSALATNIACELDIEGPRMTLATVCSSSALALAAARELLRMQDIDHVLVVGAETLSEVSHAGFNSLRSVAPRLCQPFDANRKGLILGEGAGAMVLERPDAAARRGAAALAFFEGYSLMTDLHHFTAPQPEGRAIAQTMQQALQQASVDPALISYINAHGTGTMLNDAAEARGIRLAFGSHAAGIPVSSTKSMIGHQMGAAGILEGIVTVLSLRHGVIPPTANLETPDPECLLDCVPGTARSYTPGYALSNSFAFGGSNISIVFGKHARSGEKFLKRTSAPEQCQVITGIGIASPLGIGKKAFRQSLAEGETCLSSLAGFGEPWAAFQGGVIDAEAMRALVPSGIRRLQNRQSMFLYCAFKEALEEAGLNAADGSSMLMAYGSAFGCSGNVHRFYTQLLREGPKTVSPIEFGMSVTNAPAAIMAQEFGLQCPLWVFVGDEASWELSLNWAAQFIRSGMADQAIVCAAEEISDSVLAIHDSLGLLASSGRPGLRLGEGALCMVIESEARARARSARIYGTLEGLATVQTSVCGPQDFPDGPAALDHASACCMEKASKSTADLFYVSAANGTPQVAAADTGAFSSIKKLWQGRTIRKKYWPLFGESGITGGLGLAAVLLDLQLPPASRGLILTCARGGVTAATLVRRS
jgi:3-oxoacyl-[acyl-carrier-protein] synthase II